MKSPLPQLLAPLLAPLLALLLLPLALLPETARAYTVLSPGELLRMDAMIVWEAGQEVLLLSPVVRGGGTLILPLPEGARLLETRPEAPGWLGTAEEAVADPASDGGGDDGPPGDGRILDEMPSPRPTKVSLGEREAPRAADALGLGLAPDEGPPPIATAGKILVVPADRLAAALESVGTPRPGLDGGALLREAPMVLVAALPRDPVAIRVSPVAVAFDSVWPGIPLAVDSRLDPHPLALQLLGASPTRDLGGMDFAFGLKATSGPGEVPVSLMAWLEQKLERPDRGWRRSHFSAGAMDPDKARQAKLTDLRLPPPLGARRAAKRARPAPSSSPPPPTASARKTSESCEGCASSGEGAALASLLLFTLGLSRRGSR